MNLTTIAHALIKLAGKLLQREQDKITKEIQQARAVIKATEARLTEHHQKLTKTSNHSWLLKPAVEYGAKQPK